ARAAPRGPDVDHDRVSPQLLDPGLVGVDAAAEELVGLAVERGERRRRARQCLRVVRVSPAAFVASATGQNADGDGDRKALPQSRQFHDYNTYRSVRQVCGP